MINNNGKSPLKMDTIIRNRMIELLDCTNRSVNKICEDSNITTSTINTYLNRKCEYCNMRTIVRICEGLNISIYDFFNTDLFKQKTFEEKLQNEEY